MEKRSGKGKTAHVWKKIIEDFMQVQESEYYDRIMLLVGVKFAEIVKIDETIEDGLKSGKIARVATSPGSSGLLKKKREEIAAVSYRGRKTQKLVIFLRLFSAFPKVLPSLLHASYSSQ